MVIFEETRELFEELAFAQRFLCSVVKNPNPPRGTDAFNLISDKCPTKAEFIKRNEKGYYEDATLNAMWWAWREALKQYPS